MLLTLLLIAALSVVQSLFGVGLLVFGTPLFLLMGLPFHEVLWTLLPASLTISVLQLTLDKGITREVAFLFAWWAIPGLLLGLLASLLAGVTFKMDWIVATLLIFTASLRLLNGSQAWLSTSSKKYSRQALVLIGVLHGVTNMGGSLLSAYAGAQHNDKYNIRQTVALGYAVFALVQLITLKALEYGSAPLSPFYPAITAGFVFLSIGRLTFHRITYKNYNVLFSAFELLCASLLIFKAVT
jgi:uncharacterized membrane protein YfcA